jgi:hypothetical protein
MSDQTLNTQDELQRLRHETARRVELLTGHAIA